MLTTIVFDFDGTIVHTLEASWALFRETNERFELGIDSPAAFYRLFERNFFAALDEVSGGPGSVRAEEVRRHFQELLRTRYRPALVPGMASVVRDLAGFYTLVILSSNSMKAVRDILLRSEVAHCFAHVLSGDVAPDKRAAIRRMLDDPSLSWGRRCSPHYEETAPPRKTEPGEMILITDTIGDVEDGQRAGIRVGAVAWGMHSADALERAGAEFVCIWPEELVAYLRPGEECAAGPCRLSSASQRSPGSVPEFSALRTEAAAVRRARRIDAATSLTSRLAAKSTPQPGGDPVLLRVLSALGGAEPPCMPEE